MRLALFVPGLLLPKEILADTVFDLTAPALCLLLGRGRRDEQESAWLASAFGLDGNTPLPAAALRRAACGATAPRGEWLCLDPVHLEVRREGIILADPARLALTAEEAAALREAIQPLLTEWGELYASAPDCWEVSLARPVELKTMPLAEAIGRRVDPDHPGGADGRAFRHLIAQAQTLLHAHPVNRRREEEGKPVINSLWPWGGGKLPDRVRSDFDLVWDEDPVTAGLCAQAGIPCEPPPMRFQAASGKVLVHLDWLAAPCRNHDALAWREALLALEQAWLAPSVAALKQKKCIELTLVGTCLDSNVHATIWRLSRADLWRFWRRMRPLSELE